MTLLAAADTGLLLPLLLLLPAVINAVAFVWLQYFMLMIMAISTVEVCYKFISLLLLLLNSQVLPSPAGVHPWGGAVVQKVDGHLLTQTSTHNSAQKHLHTHAAAGLE